MTLQSAACARSFLGRSFYFEGGGGGGSGGSGGSLQWNHQFSW